MVQISERLLTQIEASTIQLRRELDKGQRRIGTFEKLTNKTLGRIDKRFDRLGRSIDKSLSQALKPANLKKMTLALSGTAAGFAFATKKAIEFADTIGKTADKIGVTTDELQELRFAAQQTGVATNQLDLGLQRFVRRTAEAAEGTGELVKVLEKYDIDVKGANGETRDSIEILKDLADATQNASSESEQLRIAFKAFDSEGAALVNLLRQGSEGLERFQRQARDLGLVMDENLIRKAEQANDELNILAQSLKVQVAGSLASISPAIIEIGKNLRDVIPVIVEFWERWALPANMQSVEMLNMRMAELLQTIRAFESGRSMELPSILPGISNAEEARAEFDRLEKLRAEAIKTREALAALRETRTAGVPVAQQAIEITDEESDAIARRIIAMNEDIRVTDESSDAITERMMAMRESIRITDEEAEAITGRLKEINEAQKETTEATVNYAQTSRSALREAENALEGNLRSWEDWGAAVLRILQEVIVAQVNASRTPTPSGGAASASTGLLGLGVLGLNKGGTVPIKAASGMTVPGSGNTDTVDAKLTPGEEVINAKQAEKFRPVLKAINAGKVKMNRGGTVGMPQMMASGGTVTNSGGNISIGTIDARGAGPGTAEAIEGAIMRVAARMGQNRFGTTSGQRRRDMIGVIRRGAAADFV